MIVTLGGGAALVRDALQAPSIDIIASDQAKPFEIPFAVGNRSSFFTMYGTWLNCGIDNALSKQGGGIAQLSIADHRSATIEPGDVSNFRCNLGFPANDLASAHIFLTVTYKTFGIFTRHSRLIEFTWDSNASPPVWIKGPIAH